jgi:hypothetical protein
VHILVCWSWKSLRPDLATARLVPGCRSAAQVLAAVSARLAAVKGTGQRKLTGQWRAYCAAHEYHFKDFDRDRRSDRTTSPTPTTLFESVNLIVCWGSSGPAQLRDGASCFRFVNLTSIPLFVDGQVGAAGRKCR